MTTSSVSHPPGQGTYDVARPGGKCAVCGAIIIAGEKFIAVLRETPDGLERLDISQDCWTSFHRERVLAYWQTTMPAAEEKKKLFVDDAILCELFERLATAEEPSKLNFRFVLGLILMRKRLLVYESSRHAGNDEIWSVRMKGKAELLDLLNPRLNETQIVEVSTQLGEILNSEF